MASHTPDPDYHEVHLNGKQLVFLFMAVTAVSVVLFLCGVLVGRGVRAAGELQAAAIAAPEAVATVAAPEPTVESSDAALPAVDERADPRIAAPPRAVADFDEPAAAAGNIAPPAEPTSSGVSTPPAVPAVAAAPAPRPAASEPRPAPPAVAAAQSEPPAAASGRPGDWAVQVAALNVRSDADEIAKRLASKGYATYVVSPPGGNRTVFRVRVGPFATRRDADTMAARLQREEQFKPWVTR
jgi:cell division septation protein DedD